MEHSHIIIDKDNHFIIDPVTRKIKPETHEKNKLVEGDHKSERYTFELPKIIEGHDMSECDVVQIHYLNVSADKKNKVEDIYDVDDLGVLESKPDTLAFTWLIKEPATRYSGLLSFAMVFKCTTGDIIDYAWHTEIYSNISIAKSMNNSAAIVEEYSDILAQWKEELFGVEGKIQTALRNSLTAIENKSTETLKSISTKSTETLNTIDKTAKDTTTALEQKSQEVVKAIEDYGVVQVSEEEPTNPNVDLHINPNEKVVISVPEIDDENVSLEDTWSSQKISEEIKNNLATQANNWSKVMDLVLKPNEEIEIDSYTGTTRCFHSVNPHNLKIGEKLICNHFKYGYVKPLHQTTQTFVYTVQDVVDANNFTLDTVYEEDYSVKRFVLEKPNIGVIRDIMIKKKHTRIRGELTVIGNIGGSLNGNNTQFNFINLKPNHINSGFFETIVKESELDHNPNNSDNVIYNLYRTANMNRNGTKTWFDYYYDTNYLNRNCSAQSFEGLYTGKVKIIKLPLYTCNGARIIIEEADDYVD